MTPRPGRGLAACALAAALLAAGIGPLVAGAAAPRRPAARPTAARRVAPARDTLRPAAAPYDSAIGDSLFEGEVFMAWHAPYGAPGARSDLTFSCDDSSRVDTLYLSLVTGRDLPQLVALFGRIYLHPAFGDSLGPHWHYGRGGENNGSLLVQLDPDGTFPCAQPWGRPGMGATMFEIRKDVGELMVIYAVPMGQGVPLDGRKRYCFGRLLFKHRNCDWPSAREPICVEWHEADFNGGGHDFPIRRGAGRFVSINSPKGDVCTPYRRSQKPPVWQPPAWRAPQVPGTPPAARGAGAPDSAAAPRPDTTSVPTGR